MIAPIPLQKSLATLSTLAVEGSPSWKILIDFLGCSRIMDHVNNCSFLLDGDVSSFGFLTNLEMDSVNSGFYKSNQLLKLMEGFTNCPECKHWQMNRSVKSQNDMIIISGAQFQTGHLRNLQMQYLFHNFHCPTRFENLIANARLKVVPDLNLELVEFQLENDLLMQIMMPIHAADLLTLVNNFHNIGFEIMDALNQVDYKEMNIFLPVTSLKSKMHLKDALGQSTLAPVFRANNSDFEFMVNILQVLQFNTLTIYPQSKIQDPFSAAVLINRPFIFRLFNATTLTPSLIGLITCPSDENSNHGKCFDIQRTCKKHHFCSRLEDICSLWSQCQ